jgi:hypothetical protein
LFHDSGFFFSDTWFFQIEMTWTGPESGSQFIETESIFLKE